MFVAAVPYDSLRYLARLSDLRPSAGAFKSEDFAFANVLALSNLLSNAGLVVGCALLHASTRRPAQLCLFVSVLAVCVQFGGDFLNWGYLANSPAVSVTVLWAVPLLAPLIFALVSALLDCILVRRR